MSQHHLVRITHPHAPDLHDRPAASPFNPGYYESAELAAMGFNVGKAVRVARNCTIIGLDGRSFENIVIGDNVRIDGLTTIAASRGSLRIGSNVHIGGFGFLLCTGGVDLDDYANISQRVAIYSASDDFSGEWLTSPMSPAELTNIEVAPVRLGRHVIVGSGSVILPGASIGEGAAVGALSLVRRSLEAWGIYAGSPARRIGDRSKRLLDLERQAGRTKPA